MTLKLNVSSTRLIWINSLVDNVDDSAVTDAVITMDVDDLDGTSIVTGITFTHTSSGSYYGKFLHGVDLVDGTVYILKITITSADGFTVRYIESRVKARVDRGV